jgi:hypothetical protein
MVSLAGDLDRSSGAGAGDPYPGSTRRDDDAVGGSMGGA